MQIHINGLWNGLKWAIFLEVHVIIIFGSISKNILNMYIEKLFNHVFLHGPPNNFHLTLVFCLFYHFNVKIWIFEMLDLLKMDRLKGQPPYVYKLY